MNEVYCYEGIIKEKITLYLKEYFCICWIENINKEELNFGRLSCEFHVMAGRDFYRKKVNGRYHTRVFHYKVNNFKLNQIKELSLNNLYHCFIEELRLGDESAILLRNETNSSDDVIRHTINDLIVYLKIKSLNTEYLNPKEITFLTAYEVDLIGFRTLDDWLFFKLEDESIVSKIYSSYVGHEHIAAKYIK